MLMVWSGKRKDKPFHPTIRIRDTGYARNHYQIQFYREGLFIGSYCVREVPKTADIVKHYFDELARCGHRPV